MKSLIKAVALAAVLAAPLAAFAQASQQPVTRADVRNDLIRVEHAGYNPATANDANYPADIQAAEQRAQALNRASRRPIRSPIRAGMARRWADRRRQAA